MLSSGGGGETRWIDAQIRWDDGVDDNAAIVAAATVNNGGPQQESAGEEDDDGADALDPFFADPHPQETFVFAEQPPPPPPLSDSIHHPGKNNNNGTKIALNNDIINVRLDGYKADADQVWQSTGLTLWSAAWELSRYLLHHAELVRPGRTILEVRCLSSFSSPFFRRDDDDDPPSWLVTALIDLLSHHHRRPSC
jgi:hypothetical protein